MKTHPLTPLTTLLITIACTTTSGQGLADVFERVHTSVVTIRSTVGVREDLVLPERPTSRIGSGVLISRAGTIVTSAHVVRLADLIEVEFADSTVIPARIVSIERAADLALLKLHGSAPEECAVASLGDSDAVRVGSRVFIIGAPFDLHHSLTVGYVSARRKDESFLGSMRHVEHFQTDAAINRGNSGGPMFDMEGEVVGIVCHIMTTSGMSEGFGFVVTSNAVRELLLERKNIWLGFDTLPLPPEFARALNVPDGRSGLLVQRIALASPGEALGLRGGTVPVTIAGREVLLGGDIIVAILGHDVGSPDGVKAAGQAIRKLSKGDELTLTVLRAGKLVELSALLLLEEKNGQTMLLDPRDPPTGSDRRETLSRSGVRR